MVGLLQRQAKSSPRPILIEQATRYSKEHRRRLEVKPGITGLDVKILFKTIWVVIFKREGIYGKDGVTRDYEG
jgi:lipopolysaccharide/colanic/teichoic acid biosynthesis glycosyltransferase